MNKNITSRDVAREAGVSQSLVSLILNNTPGKKIKMETRQHVFEVAEKLGYKVNVNARSMKNKNASSIGLLSSWDTSSFVFPPVIDGVRNVCFENDLGVIVCSDKKNSAGNYDFVDYYLENRISGIIYISYVGIKDEGIISILKDSGIPFVCIIGARDLIDVSCVDVSFLESGYVAVKHLIDNGYKNIGYIMYNKEELLNYGEKERLEGCKKAAKEFNANLYMINEFINISKENCETMIDNILNNSFDSIVSTSYMCYLILKEACKKNIKIPDSLGVISLDNEQYAPFLFPSLTTIDEPLFDIARAATNILIEKVNGNNSCKKIEISPKISVRESTMPNKVY